MRKIKNNSNHSINPSKQNGGFKKGLLLGFFSGAVCLSLAGGCAALIFLGAGPFASAQRVDLLKADVKLRKMEQLLDEHYLNATASDASLMQEYLLKGATAALNDPYAAYYTAEEQLQAAQKNEGHYSGIGVQVSKQENGDLRIETVYDNGPAAQAGIAVGDLIRAVDGVDVTGVDLDALVADYIAGEGGSELTLSVYRPTTREQLTLTITRGEVELISAEGKMLDDGHTGYIHISSFTDATPDQFFASIDALLSDGMDGLIIDLRDNTGGIVGSAVQMLGRILPDGLLLRTEDVNGKGDRYLSKSGKILFESDYHRTLDGWPKEDGGTLSIPIVLLVNARTASASELFAQALRDYGAAKLVGTKTFGKGIIQNTYPLGDGSAFKFTTAHYFTKSGYLIQGQGITPDVYVEATQKQKESDAVNDEREQDTQLNTALDVLQGLG